MSQLFLRIFLLIALPISLMATLPTSVFAAEPIAPLMNTSITGQVWVDSNASGAFDPQEATLTNLPVFIQLVDQDDFAMTLVVYTDEIGGFAAEGLPAGTYQIWTENDSDGVFLQLVTLSESAPTATANLPIVGHRVFMPTVMR